MFRPTAFAVSVVEKLHTGPGVNADADVVYGVAREVLESAPGGLESHALSYLKSARPVDVDAAFESLTKFNPRFSAATTENMVKMAVRTLAFEAMAFVKVVRQRAAA